MIIKGLTPNGVGPFSCLMYFLCNPAQ